MNTVQGVLLLMVLAPLQCWAAETCESGKGVQTPAGRPVSTDCVDAGGYVSRQWIAVGTEKLLVDEMLVREDRSPSKTSWVYRGVPKAETGCSERLYLVDLSLKPVKVLAFGVKGACNEFHWASWGEKRSVIALKHNVRFAYENGRMTLPEKGEKLWHSIEPPHAGPGLSEEEAIPFVHEVPPPN